MIIECQSCSSKFVVQDSDIPREGRNVKCGNCSVTWRQMPISVTPKIKKPQEKIKINNEQVDEALSVDSIKASDGKRYKFLGSQWAQLLPSGKTGLFAKKKIGKELDKLTGRKIEGSSTKRGKKQLNPSSQIINIDGGTSNTHQQNNSLGFFGYIFLIIIIGFSFVGILKTFEDDLLNYFPELEYIYILFNEQLEYLAETVKNIIVIFNDLIDSY